MIADVHGNSDALAAVLADIDAQGITAIVALGDHVSGPMAPAESAALLMARPLLAIRGNHDRWVTDQAPEAMYPSDRIAREQLSPEQLGWLRALPPTASIGGEIFLCHGTPGSDLTYWMESVLPDGRVLRRAREEIEAEAAGLPHGLLLCAHSHRPRALRLSGGRLLLNPGSVGCPAYEDDSPPHLMEAGLPDACYAVLEREGAQWRASFRFLPYDTTRMVALARAAGREGWVNAVGTGWMT
ncbi:metallophosphatase family protein [Roseomonas sp. GC11]|uniref:metallophosphoesterase family protein n=1 Tax=Roseomonas sp. GC11 TaxID=2950546 RepID=UPI002108F8AF|nr:metallophosphatase family protein [Roseomonas sp. GC11]